MSRKGFNKPNADCRWYQFELEHAPQIDEAVSICMEWCIRPIRNQYPNRKRGGAYQCAMLFVYRTTLNTFADTIESLKPLWYALLNEIKILDNARPNICYNVCLRPPSINRWLIPVGRNKWLEHAHGKFEIFRRRQSMLEYVTHYRNEP